MSDAGEGLSSGETSKPSPPTTSVAFSDIPEPSLANVAYSREAAQDKVREKIAMLLLWLLIAEVAGIGLIFVFAEVAERFGLAVKWVDLKDLIGLVMTPTITLVGTALGFYFGAKAEAEKHRA